MNKTILIAAATAMIGLTAFTGAAEARMRSGTFVGPRGGVTTWSAQRNCAGGTCTGSKTVTGPLGGTRSWEGTRTCSGGSCTSQGSYTGPPAIPGHARAPAPVRAANARMAGRSPGRAATPGPIAARSRAAGDLMAGSVALSCNAEPPDPPKRASRPRAERTQGRCSRDTTTPS